MSDRCKNCGCTKSQTIADAKTLGLTEEFENGVYSCCQIAEWAQEQWAAWLEATQQDIERVAEAKNELGLNDLEGVLVPVRLRKSVPWYKRPDR